MNDVESEINQYQSQLSQVQLAISALPEGPEKSNLYALEKDLKELIALSQSNLPGVINEKDLSKDDPLADEYNLFKAELAELNSEPSIKDRDDSGSTSSSSIIQRNVDLKKELSNLQGTKCQAPFIYKWTSDVTYHNAFVSHVPDSEEVNEFDKIEVKVLFTNPTHKEMLPCPYYLKGDCKFSDDKCRYSHGEIVLLSNLREYREPVFSDLVTGSQVFAKQDDELWYRAVVLSVSDACCLVKFDSNSKEENIPLHNILPLDSSENRIDESSDSDSNSDCNVQCDDGEDTVNYVVASHTGGPLGDWEKFTKGIGSKLMEKMGYVHGSGLGKDGKGRVEPVSAVVYPAGKSLDHCMMLKEKAGNDSNLFKAERKMKQLQRKHEERLKRAYENEKNKTDVFTFLNTKLDPTRSEAVAKTEIKKPLKSETTRNLNVTCLQLSEEMKKVEKEIKSLNQSLARHKPQSPAFNIIKGKIASQESKLSQLHASERKIMNEKDQRRDRKKLTVF